jgi:hypothetical protein
MFHLNARALGSRLLRHLAGAALAVLMLGGGAAVGVDQPTGQYR